MSSKVLLEGSTEPQPALDSQIVDYVGTDDNGEEEEDVFYENPQEIIREFGNHPLMDRIQATLTKKLKETNYSLNIELLEKKDELKKVTLDRETIGVQLYALQQQLARIQLMLENAHNEHNRILDNRLNEEELLKNISKNNTEQLALLDEYKKQQKKYVSELEGLNETIRQIEEYNDQVKSEIAISRRVAYKTEQNMTDLEKIKENQDYFVDQLTVQINKLKDQIEFTTKQFEIQKQETNDAQSIVMETVKELELISTEKQQLMIQWKAALSGLSRRDEALAQAEQTLAIAESSVHDYDVEIDATKREIQKEQSKHETLVSLRDRLENELSWVEENLIKIQNERNILQERFTLLSKSLAQTDAENKKLDLLTKSLDHDLEVQMSNLQTVTQERQKMEEDLQVLYSTHANVHKAVNNLSRDTMKLIKFIHEKENEISEIENVIMKVKIDQLNTESVNTSFKETLNSFSKEIKEKEMLSSKYSLEIRQRNDEIEKKMYRVDRLNKKYEKMVESVGGNEENLGPLENTIKNLMKENESIMNENKELEREWLRRQTEMVHILSECDDLSEKNNEQQSRVTVLTQQQLRLIKDLRELKSNIKINNTINNNYQKDISKLNALISENHSQEHELQAANYIIEMDCVEELKTLEVESISLSNQIHEIKNSKSCLLDEIVEMERQAMLWEKKIQLDKETRQALDPTVGVAENESMEKEIHRMELRLDALKREQERLTMEMERALLKRDTIANRYANGKGGNSGGAGSMYFTQSSKSNKSTSAPELTQAAAKKKIGLLKKESKSLAEETTQYTLMYEEKRNKLQEISSELENTTAEYGNLEEICHSLQNHINHLLYQKQLLQERISYRQKFSSKLKELTNGFNLDISQSLGVERKYISSTQALDNVKEIINELILQFPHLKEVLERVFAMTDPCVDVDQANSENIPPQ
jgi:chromosome segregation ATPase